MMTAKAAVLYKWERQLHSASLPDARGVDARVAFNTVVYYSEPSLEAVRPDSRCS